MIALLHRFLFLFPPEMAHHVALFFLKLWQWLRFKLLRRRIAQMPAGKGIRVAGVPKLVFPSRVGLAAGFDKNAEVFAALASLGLGFIEVGTVTPLPQEGNPKPRIERKPGYSLVNSMGFPNCGLGTFRDNILRYRGFIPGVPLLANIGKGKATPNEKAAVDYAMGFGHLEDCVDGFVVNLSSPNTPGLRDLQTKDFLEKIVGVAPGEKPVLIKLAPDLPDDELGALSELIGSIERLAGVVVTNTSRGLAESLFGAAAGGLSGKPLGPRALECVKIARSRIKGKLVVGVGGILTAYDAARMLEAGADLVEIYTGFVYRGPKLIRELKVL